MPLTPLLQAATAIATTDKSGISPMQILGVASASIAFIIMVCGGAVYAYKLGWVNREMVSTKDNAVSANETLAAVVRDGFAAVHRRLDESEVERREAREVAEARRDEWTRWRGEAEARIDRAQSTALRASKRAHRAATLTQGAITQLAVHENKIGALEGERRQGPPDRRDKSAS